MPFIQYLNIHREKLNKLLWLMGSTPLLFLTVNVICNNLGSNPIEYIMAFSGHSAIIFFVITLSITPLRRWLTALSIQVKWLYGKRLSDWNFLIYNRRMLGLWSFYYSMVHVLAYLYFEMDFYWEDIYLDINEKPFILFGYIALLGLLALAITSPTILQKRLKKNWRRIHRSIYLIAMVISLHIVLETKLLTDEVMLYILLIFIMLLHRLLSAFISPLLNTRDDGMEVKRR